MRKCLKIVVGLVVLYSATATAAPATMEEMKATVDALQSKLQAQQGRLDQLENRVAQDMKLEMAKVAKELAADAAKQSATPAWLDNLKFYGDFRLRAQFDCADDTGEEFSSAGDTRRQKNRNRVRFRLRFGFIKTWLDEQLTVGVRLASGERVDSGSPFYPGSDPTTTNQTFTNFFSEKDIWIDRAYAIYKPKAVPGLVVAGGKVGVPFVHTDLIWDEDVNPEGFWAQYSKAFGPIEPFISMGYFIAYDNWTGDDQYDTTLHFYQLGSNWQVCDALKWTFAASYYDFDHTSVATGADSLGFQMINLTNKFGFKVFDLPWSVYVDYVHNCDNRLDLATDENMDDGVAVGLKVGQNKKKGDWSVAYKYAYIESFCTPFLFNDSDFNHTNSRGHVLRAKYNLTDFLTLGGSVFFLQTINDSAVFDDVSGEEEITTQIDLMWSF